MTEPEAFKIGFIAKCASEGLSVEKITRLLEEELMEKRSWSPFGAFGTFGTSLASKISRLMFAPFILGIPIGYLAGKGTGRLLGSATHNTLPPPPPDVQELDEIVEAIELGVEELRRSRERARRIRELRGGRYR